jgi:hypothetical protein
MQWRAWARTGIVDDEAEIDVHGLWYAENACRARVPSFLSILHIINPERPALVPSSVQVAKKCVAVPIIDAATQRAQSGERNSRYVCFPDLLSALLRVPPPRSRLPAASCCPHRPQPSGLFPLGRHRHHIPFPIPDQPSAPPPASFWAQVLARQVDMKVDRQLTISGFG